MNSFQHHVLRRGDIKVIRDGKRVTVHIDASPAERLTIEISDASLSVVDADSAALPKATVRLELN